MLYLSLKAAHLIFVIAWMASMLIYPRYKIHQLEANNADTNLSSPLFDTMSAAAARLRKTIMTPSMILVWILGIVLLVLNPDLLSAGWLQAKLVLVLAMTGIHGFFIGLGRKVDNGSLTMTPKTLRLLNEVPFLLLIVIVILVIVKPF